MEDCTVDSNSLIDHEVALEKILGLAKKPTSVSSRALTDSLGLVLAEDIFSPINVPAFDNSAMDGYAIHVPDQLMGKPGVKVFLIVSRVVAGEVGEPLKPNEACRIFTGAQIPEGANTVLKQEDCDDIDGLFVEVYTPIISDSNIRLKAQDISKNSLIITKGTRITPLNIGAIASMGINEVSVYDKLSVGLLCTGSELIDPGDKSSPGKIFNSNIFSIESMLTALNCNVINAGTISDSFTKTKDTLNQLSQKCDIVITTGGVSVGDEDHVKSAVGELGSINLWKAKVKPGKPIAFGKINDSSFIGLPGNPVSAIITLMIYGVPFIKKLQGIVDYQNKKFTSKVNFERKHSETRREFVRVSIEHNDNGGHHLNLHPSQSSNILTSITESTGFAELQENQRYNMMDVVSYYDFTKILNE